MKKEIKKHYLMTKKIIRKKRKKIEWWQSSEDQEKNEHLQQQICERKIGLKVRSKGYGKNNISKIREGWHEDIKMNVENFFIITIITDAPRRKNVSIQIKIKRKGIMENYVQWHRTCLSEAVIHTKQKKKTIALTAWCKTLAERSNQLNVISKLSYPCKNRISVYWNIRLDLQMAKPNLQLATFFFLEHWAICRLRRTCKIPEQLKRFLDNSARNSGLNLRMERKK